MNKFISALLIVAVVVSSTSAFTTQSSSLTSRTQTTSSPIITGPSFDITSSSSTALNLKVDPNSIKGKGYNMMGWTMETNINKKTKKPQAERFRMYVEDGGKDIDETVTASIPVT